MLCVFATLHYGCKRFLTMYVFCGLDGLEHEVGDGA